MRRRKARVTLAVIALILLSGPAFGLLRHYAPMLFLPCKPDRMTRIRHGQQLGSFKVQQWISLPDGSFVMLVGPQQNLMRVAATGEILWQKQIEEPHVRLYAPDAEHVLLLTQRKGEEDKSRLECLDGEGRPSWKQEIPANIRWPGRRPVADASGIAIQGENSVFKYGLDGKLQWTHICPAEPFLVRRNPLGQIGYWCPAKEFVRLDVEGKTMWSRRLEDYEQPTSMDGWSILLSAHRLTALDDNGVELWEKTTPATQSPYPLMTGARSSGSLVVIQEPSGPVIYDKQGEEVLSYNASPLTKDVLVMPMSDSTLAIVETYDEPPDKLRDLMTALRQHLGMKPNAEARPNVRLNITDMSGLVKEHLDFRSEVLGPLRIDDHEMAVCYKDMILYFEY